MSLTNDVDGTGADGRDFLATGGEGRELILIVRSLEQRMTSQKKETAEEDEARLARRLKEDRPPELKKKGHQKQFEINEEVKEKFMDEEVALSRTPAAVERARTAITEGMSLINKRQKLIKIADRSEYGWVTIDDYVEDELADNLDNEKRLFRAEVRAGRKLKMAYAAKLKKRKSWPSRKPQLGLDTGTAASLSTGTQQIVRASWPQANRVAYCANQSLGPCFLRGKLGHFRKSSPLL